MPCLDLLCSINWLGNLKHYLISKLHVSKFLIVHIHITWSLELWLMKWSLQIFPGLSNGYQFKCMDQTSLNYSHEDIKEDSVKGFLQHMPIRNHLSHIPYSCHQLRYAEKAFKPIFPVVRNLFLFYVNRGEYAIFEFVRSLFFGL